MKKISIIIVTYNSQLYIKKCLDSIFENNIYENIGYSASNTKEGLIREFNASNLINNTYTIQVIIKDIQGNFIDQAISTISII